MNSQRYSEVLLANKGRSFILELEPHEVGVIHGAIRLMLLHPEVQKYSQPFHTAAEQLRGWCLKTYELMGFTPEEIERLDSAEGVKKLCDNCGQPIDPVRLKNLPQANLCLSCKVREEKKAKDDKRHKPAG